MCGIVGYTGQREALPLLIESLRRVTYRGYDSYGVAVLNGSGIDLHKQVGAVDESEEECEFRGTVGIGHTRWATVGGVTEANAHPHLDCSGHIAIVHNGDIDNYQELRDELSGLGHNLKSETDSELIAHLVEIEHQDGDLAGALERASARLEGSYAVAAIDYRTRDLAVVRRESPVVIGVGAGEAFVASDAPAIIPYTNEVIYPEDGEVVLLRPTGVKVFRGGKEISRAVTRLDWEGSDVDRGKYEHFMLKEIHEQPRAIQATGRAYLEAGPRSPVLGPSSVLILACGSSFHAAMTAAAMIKQTSGIDARAEVASEYVHNAGLPSNSLVVAISQSGETADTLNAVRDLKSRGQPVLGITNVPQSSLARLSDGVFITQAGPEVAVAATKTFTSQLVALSMLSSELSGSPAIRLGMLDAIDKLPRIVGRLLEDESTFSAAGAWLASFNNLFVVAKGANYPVALEAALKLKEVAYLHAEGVPAGELKHGPFALLDSNTPVMAVVDDDRDRQRMVTALREIKARGAPVLILGNSTDTELINIADHHVPLPRIGAGLSPIVNTVATQLLSYHAALIRGCPIDRPRNLAKSVTVL